MSTSYLPPLARKNPMVAKKAPYLLLIFVLASVLNPPLIARERGRKLQQLTDKDKSAIVGFVFTDGFGELNAKLETPNILNKCPSLILGNEEVVFVSARNLDPKFVPKVAGVHFEFMTPEAIEKAVKENDEHCFIEFSRFEVVGSKVLVNFGKYLKRPAYIYGEAFRYEFTKVSGKWRGTYLGKIITES